MKEVVFEKMNLSWDLKDEIGFISRIGKYFLDRGISRSKGLEIGKFYCLRNGKEVEVVKNDRGIG